MLTDLHIHTYYSDGVNSPQEVAAEAAAKGVKLISVSDHNTVKAYPELREACARYGLTLINGVEIDCSYEGKGYHVLAYGFDMENKALLAFIKENIHKMKAQSEQLIEKMSKVYPTLDVHEYRHFKRNLRMGGWKGVDYLRVKGFDVRFPKALDYYVNFNCVRPDNADISDVLEVIRQSGGVAVLAHPGESIRARGKEFELTLNKLIRTGIQGVECHYPSHSPEVTEVCLKACADNDLLITCGCDSHGEFAKNARGVECSIGILKVDNSWLKLGQLLEKL